MTHSYYATFIPITKVTLHGDETNLNGVEKLIMNHYKVVEIPETPDQP